MDRTRLFTAMWWAFCIMVLGACIILGMLLFIIAPGIIQVIFALLIVFGWLTLICYQIVKGNEVK